MPHWRTPAGLGCGGLDADDRLDEKNRRAASDLFSCLGDEPDAYAMKVRSRLNAAGTAARWLDQVRLFPRHPDIRWRFRVHEQIMPAVRRRGGGLRWADVCIDHVGYQDRSARRRKLERNLRLLRLEDAEHPDDPYTLFNLGWTSLDLGRPAEAIDYLRRSHQRVRRTASYVRKLCVLLAQAYHRTGQTAKGLETCDEALAQFSDDRELLFQRAELLHALGNPVEAESTIRRMLAIQPGQYLASVDAGLCGYRARHLWGDICRAQGRLDEAEQHWQAAIAERADYAPVWVALGGLWLDSGRWTDAEDAIRQLSACNPGGTEATLLNARCRLAQGDQASARRLLEEGLARAPKARALRQLLEQLAPHRA